MLPGSSDPYWLAARWYDHVIEPLNRKLKAMALRFRPPVPGTTVLDVGCGTGTLLELYRQAGCEVWGMDLSPAMLQVARRRLGAAATLVEGDATRMPFPDGRFDRVTFSLVLHEMAPTIRRSTLGEAGRVLARGGEVVAIDYAARPLGFPRGWALRALVTVIERSAGRDHWRGYRHFVRHGAVAGLAAELGWEIVTERTVGDGNLAVTVLRPGGRAGEAA